MNLVYKQDIIAVIQHHRRRFIQKLIKNASEMNMFSVPDMITQIIVPQLVFQTCSLPKHTKANAAIGHTFLHCSPVQV